ncbi:Two-component system protein B [Lasiodiplodia hormozganensis]|uniref:histidine kinase n=1 Tax=Lasiodiplodia hormozganensis TaxID=869390 RepID=A0AA39XUW6_9PEZI|nr:Two-component system protein B [Lasiodiplodia hormozganensis]
MRIPIREQLGFLVLLVSLVALAVIAAATWVTNHNFVLDIRASRLTLTASLKASQLASNLLLMQSTVRSASSRIVIQRQLQRYNDGNVTYRSSANWTTSQSDLAAVFDGGQQMTLLLQAQVWPKNYTGPAADAAVFRATASVASGKLALPMTYDNGSTVYLGDSGLGYPPQLYPNMTFTSQRLNDTFNETLAQYAGQTLNETGSILLGPWELNKTFSLMSLTVPIINNTSAFDVLGWITVVMDAKLIYQTVDAGEGLDNSGITLIVGPDTINNKFPPGVLYSNNSGSPPEDVSVRFVLPPSDLGGRHNSQQREVERRRQFRIPEKVKDRKHLIHDELTDLTTTFNEMTDELMMQYEKLEERVKQRTAELEEAMKAAEAANESKTLFIANISHELKTPLNGILGMCAVCMSEDDPVKLKRSMGIIYKSGDLLLNLLTDLLTFSKNQMGHQQLSLDEKEFRLRDVSTQVLAIFDKQAKESGITLSVRFEGPADLNPDESAQRANHINILHDKAYAHILEAERAPSPPPGRFLAFEFEVEDTGPGVPEHLQQRIFEPFVQGDLGLSKKYGGTGLGLSICQQLATLMKGTINLRSSVGQGSTFTVEIPLKHLKTRADSTASSRISDPANGSRKSSLSIESPTSRTAEESTGAASVPFETDSQPRLVGLRQPFFASPTPLDSPSSQGAAMDRIAAQTFNKSDRLKVLVAEDNKTNQEVVLRMLKLEDVYDVSIAKDGQEALDKVKESMENQNPYDLIFMDVQMPNLDGIQSTRLIRQAGYSAPIVALTAYAEESNVKECYESGMDYFLSKPIRRPALKHVLKTYCAPIPEETEPGDSPPLDSKKKKGAAYKLVARSGTKNDTPEPSPLS